MRTIETELDEGCPEYSPWFQYLNQLAEDRENEVRCLLRPHFQSISRNDSFCEEKSTTPPTVNPHHSLQILKYFQTSLDSHWYSKCSKTSSGWLDQPLTWPDLEFCASTCPCPPNQLKVLIKANNYIKLCHYRLPTMMQSCVWTPRYAQPHSFYHSHRLARVK